MNFLSLDWSATFMPEMPLVELMARGTALYFGLLILVRIMPRRTGGEVATMDLIFVLLLAEAASHALGDYTSVGDGLIIIVTLMAWNWLMNALSYRVSLIERLISAPPIEVIRNGKLLHRNMRREYLTEEELMGHLRLEGIDRITSVRSARVEGAPAMRVRDALQLNNHVAPCVRNGWKADISQAGMFRRRMAPID